MKQSDGASPPEDATHVTHEVPHTRETSAHSETHQTPRGALPWWAWAAWLVAVILGVIAYRHLPTQVINSHGKMRPRLLVVLYEPTLMLVPTLLWHVLWRIDPKRRNYAGFWSTYRYIGGVIVVSMGLIYIITLGHVLHIGSMRLLPTVIGILFMLIANVAPRLQPNWWVGFRTPWTLSSEQSWIRTHRLGGQLGIPLGLLIIILGWVLPLNAAMRFAIIGPVLVWVLSTVIASYFFAQEKGTKTTN